MSIALLFWITVKIEGLLGGFLQSVIGADNYIPGFGIVVSFLLIILTGSLVSNYITRRFIQFFLDQFGRIPFVKAIYGPLKDLMQLFGDESAKEKMKRVVWVEFDSRSGKRLGLVTRDTFDDLGLEEETEDYIAVYIPLSFMLGGYTILVHKSKVTEADFPVDKALKLAITGWVHIDNKSSEK